MQRPASRRRTLGLLAGAICMFASPLPAAEPSAADAGYKSAPGPYEVQTALFDWTDQARNRPVPVKIYFPKEGPGPFPVIVFSHGLGGSRDGYEYLGRHWAGHGYVSLHVEHKGSNREVWQGKAQPKEALSASAGELRNALERPRDVSFAIDQLARLNRERSPLKGRLDMDKVGVAGHSFGAFTTLAVAGQVFVGPLGHEFSLADPRVKAAIPMSAPVPGKRQPFDRVYGRIRIPCLHMTGTLDDSPIGETSAKERRVPFDHIRGAEQYLITFNGGDHMIFSGRLKEPRPKDPRFQELIRMSTTAFWDAYLRGDPKAKAWLAEGGLRRTLGNDAVLETAAPRAGPAER